MDLMFGVHQRLMVTSSPCSNGIFIRKISSFMKLRIIAVPVGNEIKSFQMTLGIFFLLRYFADCRQLWQFWRESTHSFVNTYSIWTRGGRHHKALMNPKHQIHSENGLTLCSNIRIFTYLKNGALLLWNL